MALVGVVKAIVTADITQFKKGMTDAQNSMARAGANMSKAGKSMTMKVTMPLVGIGLAAAKMASDFEFSMTQIETLVGRSASEVEMLKGAVLGLSGETGRAPKELADAMFFITSAGLDAASATAALEMSAKAAAVGLGDTAVVADAVTNAMNGYGMAADGAAFATDVLAKTVEQGKASAADLAPQFGRLIPMAAELGISFDQVGAGLAFLTRSSGDAALSATQLGGVMKSILKPSQQALKTFNEIGVDLGSLREAASEDLLGALQDLRVSLEANGKEMGDVFEDIRGLNGALMLTGEASGVAREVFDELADSAGKLDEAFLGVQKTAQFKITQAMSAMKAAMITLGAAILPVVVPILQTLAGIISKIAEAFGVLPGPVKTVIVILGVLLAAAGPLLMIAGSLVTAWGTLGLTAAASVAPIGAAAAATGTLGAAAAATTLTLSAVLIPLAAIIAVGAIVFTLFKKWGEEAEEAAGRQQLLTNQLRDMNDPATTMVSRIDELVEANTRLKKAIDDSAKANTEGEEAAKEFYAQQVLMKELIGRKVVGAYDKLSLSSGLLEDAVRSGTDAFDQEARIRRTLSGYASERQAALHGESQAVENLTEAVRAKVDAGTITLDQGVAILKSIGDTAQAHKDHTQKLEDVANAYMNAEGQEQKFIDLLGVETYESVQAAGAGKSHTEQLALLDDAVLAASTRIIVQNHLLNEAASMNDSVNDALVRRRAEEKRLAASAALADIGMVNSARSMQNLTDKEVAASIAAHEMRLRFAEMITAVEAGEDPLGRTAYQLGQIALMADDADRAMQQTAERSTEEAQNRAYWVAVANRNRAETLAVEEAILQDHADIADLARTISGEYQDQAAALSAQVAAGDITVAQGRDRLAVLVQVTAELEEAAEKERQAAETLQAQEDRQREALRLANAMKSAQDDVAAATRGVANAAEDVRIAEAGVLIAIKKHKEAQDDVTEAIKEHADAEADVLAAKEAHAEAEADVARAVAAATAEHERAADKITKIKERQADIDQEIVDIAQDRRDIDDEIEAIGKRITENLAEQVALEEAGTEFAASIAQEFRKAALSVLNLTDKVADLQNEVDAVAPDTAVQEGLIAGMRAQVAAVNEVEEALIDMGVISAEDAGMMDLTVREAQALVRLQGELEETTAEYEAGEASLLDLMAATEDYEQAMNEVKADSRELEKAVADLNEMISEGARIDAERAKTTLKLAIAKEDLRLAEQKGTEEVFTANRIAEEQAKLDKARLKLLDDKAVKQQKNSDLMQKAIDLDEKLAKAAEDLTAAELKEVEALAAITTARKEAQQKAEEVFAKIAEAQDEVTAAANRIIEANAEVVAAFGRIAEAEDAVTAAVARKTAADEELHYAQVRLSEIMSEVNGLAKEGEGVWGELRDIIFAVTGEFRTLIELMETPVKTPPPPVVDGGGGGGGAGGVTGGGAPATNFAFGGGTGSGAAGWTPSTEWWTTMRDQGGLNIWDQIKATATTPGDAEKRWNDLQGRLTAGQTPESIASQYSDLFQFLGGEAISAQRGGFVKSAGLVNVHAGETITPRGGGVYVTVNIEGSVSSERDLVESIRKGLLRAQQSGRAVVL